MPLFRKERQAVNEAATAVKDSTSKVTLALIVIGAIAVSALVLAVAVRA